MSNSIVKIKKSQKTNQFYFGISTFTHNRLKNYPLMYRIWLYPIFLLLLLTACQQAQNDKSATLTYSKISGQTMGTTYHVTCQTSNPSTLKADINTLLKEVNQGVNHYDKSATISLLNQATTELLLDTTQSDAKHFYINLETAKAIFESTDGALDPTIMPLVNYWGFGYTEKRAITKVDSIKVKQLVELVDFENVQIQPKEEQLYVTKKNPSVQLDFSSLAKGYGVDEVGRLLERKGIQNYLVDIGGEVRAKGVNNRGLSWRLGINTPSTEAALTAYETVISIENQSMATSGNYRNFHEVDGVKYAHTINPTTGYPERNTLLSATVLSKECMVADGYATAFMTMGLDRAYEIAAKSPALEAYFLYAKGDGTIGEKYTTGIKDLIK